MVIVETRINASVLHLFFEVFRAIECVDMRGVEDGAADSEVQVGSLEIAFQDTRHRARKTPVSREVFRVIWCDAKGHPRRVRNRVRIPVYSAVLNSRYRSPETKVVFCVPATDEGVGDGSRHHGKQMGGVGGVESAR